MRRAVLRWLGAPVMLPLPWYVAVVLATVPMVAWAAGEVANFGSATTINLAWILIVLAAVAAGLGGLQAMVGDSGDRRRKAMRLVHSRRRPQTTRMGQALETARHIVSQLNVAVDYTPVSQAMAVGAVLYLLCGAMALGALIA